MSATTFGKYELVSKLASGGMAVTYKALMVGAMGVKKPVVLKLIHPHLAEQAEFVEMFIEEARLSATLTHSNIAQVFDFGEVDGRYFIAMELVDGQALSHLLKRAQRKGQTVLPVPLALLIAVEMCEALYYAHTRTDEGGKPMNLVHRDVSPENVLISWQGEVKLVDFGIAKSTLTGKQTATGMVKGKYPYFSPEQSRADRNIDGRTDVYAATVVLYEMLCARRPYEGEFVEVMRTLLTGDYPLPTSLNPEIPTELEQLMLKGLALDRNARFRTAREMGQKLSALQHQLYPSVQRSDLQSLMSVMFEEDLKAAGRPVEIRAGFRELLAPKSSLATDLGSNDETPAAGGLKLATGKRKVSSDKQPALQSEVRPLTERRTLGPGAGKAPSQPKLAPPTRVDPSNPSQTTDDSAEDTPVPGPTEIKTTGSQLTQMTLDTPEKAAARAKAVKVIAGAAAVLFAVIAGLALMFAGKKEEPAVAKTPVWATSVPPRAKVSVDGKPVGEAPMDGLLPEGTYTFAMTLPGYRPWTKRVSVAGPRQVHVEAQLVPEQGDQPVEPVIPQLSKKPDEPVTEVAVDAGIVLNQDIKQVYTWPMRSFSVWPQRHTLALGQYRTFTLELETETAYQVSTNGSLDLGPTLGKTSAVLYYLEGDKVDPKDRLGFLGPQPKTIRNASKLYAWAFDDDASDNKGKLSFTLRVSKYIPERTVSFNVEEHVLVPATTDVLRVDGLLPAHTYRLVFRPDAVKVMGAVPTHLLCLHQTPKPKPIQKKYTWYPLKFIGTVTGITGMTCMFLAFSSDGTSGLLEVDIDDMAELKDKRVP